MRIGLLVYGQLTTLSGGNLYDLKLVERLRERGHDVMPISLPRPGYARCLLHNLSSRLARELERHDLDLLLQDELTHPSLFARNRRLDHRAPRLCIVHHLRSSEPHPWPLRLLYRQVERAYLRSVDAFVYNSTTTRRVVEEALGCAPPCVVATPGGDRLGPALASERIEERCRASGALRLLFVGNLIRRKGLDGLLRALRRLPPDLAWRLDVAGSSTSEPTTARRLRRQIEALGIGSRVNLRGQLGDIDLARLFRSSHLLVLPSSYEGFGIVLLEALGFGLPVLASAAGATTEIVEPGRCGLLLTAGDDDAWAAAIAELARDRARLLEMSRAARARYEQFPTWRESAERAARFVEDWAAD